MNKLYILYPGLLTGILIVTVWAYEKKLERVKKDLKITQLWYKEQQNFIDSLQEELTEKSNRLVMDNSHYTRLQLENVDLRNRLSTYRRESQQESSRDSIINNVVIQEQIREIKELNDTINDYKRALSLSKHPSNTTKSDKIITQLDLDNRMLQAQIEQLKLQITELKSGIHTGYPSATYDWHIKRNDE
jgi:hypothetical protein